MKTSGQMRYVLFRARHRIVGGARGPLVWLMRTGQAHPRIVMIGRAPLLHIWGRIEVGRDLRMRNLQSRTCITVGPLGRLSIGDNVFINQGVTIHSELDVRIGNRVEMGDGVTIYDTNFHPVIPGDDVKSGPVTIQDDVWLGNGVLILPGVSIGRGSVIGAGSVVTQDIPQGSLAVGAPAKVIRDFEVPLDFQRR